MSTETRTEAVTIPIHAEELRVGRRVVEGDTVTVRTVTKTRDTTIEELLSGERVEIERVAIRRIVDEAPSVREEGDTIVVPVIEEVIVTERKLFLKEEVRIRRVRETSVHHEIVTLREEDVVVTRTAPVKPDAAPNIMQRQQLEETLMASETIVAVYSTPAHAELAIDDLKAAGIPASAIEHFAQTEEFAGTTGASTDPAAATTQSHGGFWSWLTGEGADEHSASQHAMYNSSLSSGHTVVTVVVDAARADEVTVLLDKHKPLDIDQHGGAYGADGLVGGAPSLSPVDNTLEPYPAATATGMTTAATAPPIATTATGTGEQVLSLSEESLQVGKREIDRGTTRVRRYVVERPVEEQIRLRDERVSVFRRPVTGSRAGIGDSFSEKVVEVTETDEEAVVAKTARVVEEVVVQKAVDERVETIKETLRHEDVEIDKPTTTIGATTSTTTKPL